MRGSAFAVCVTQSSLTCQLEHSGRYVPAWKKCFSLLSGLASFLCAALMSPQRTKQFRAQIKGSFD